MTETTVAAQPYDDPVALITPEVVERYRTDGVVFLRQALHPEWIELVGMGLQRVLADGGQAKHKFFDDQPGEFLETVRNYDAIPEIQRLVYDSPIADMIGKLVGSERVWYYSDEFFIKGPGSNRTPWHQDLTYWPMAGDQICSMWISIDPIPASECLEYVPGTHRSVMYDGFNPRRVAEDPTLPYYSEAFPPLPDIEADRSAWPIVSWDVQPGDVVLAHPGVLHGGGPTSSTSRRRALTVRCYGEDIVYATRPSSKPTVPRTPGLAARLKPGDPLRAPWYPQLRPVPPWQAWG